MNEFVCNRTVLQGKNMSDSSNEATNEEALKAVKAHEANKTPKAIRVLTVCAYLLTVSLAAIMLSAYYIFLWDPKMPPDQPTPKRH